MLARLQGLPPECGPPPALVRCQGDWWCVLGNECANQPRQSYSFDEWSAYHEEPHCTLEMLRDSGQNLSDPMTWLSQLLKEFDRGSEERTSLQLQTLVQCMRLSVVCDQLNVPELTLSRKLFGVCQLVEAYVSGGGRRPFWDSVRRLVIVHSSSNMVPLFRKKPCSQKGKEGS